MLVVIKKILQQRGYLAESDDSHTVIRAVNWGGYFNEKDVVRLFRFLVFA